jgi:hypothetical protein
MQENEGKARILISKLEADTGAIVWTKIVKSNNEDMNASAETVQFLSDGSFVVGGGVNSNIPSNEMFFKSGGQVEEAQAWIGKISASGAAGSDVPPIEWAWTNTDGRQGNAKAIKIDANDNIFAVAGMGTATTLYKFNSAGKEQWSTGSNYDNMQLNDLVINTDGTMAMVGHTFVNNQWMGRLVGTDSAGTQQWTQDYGNYSGGTGNYAGLSAGGDWIYNECWGIAKSYTSGTTTQSGYVLACGTGIECEGGWFSGNVSQCDSDYRKNWRAMSI